MKPIPVPNSYITVVLHQRESGDYELHSAWTGRVCPSFPDDPKATPESIPFWNKHALVWGKQIVQKNFPKDLFPATMPTLRQIKTAGKLIGIITATSQYGFENDLNVHQIPRELLDYTQTADDTSFHKPDPRVFEPALEWLAKRDIRPDEVIYIGRAGYDVVINYKSDNEFGVTALFAQPSSTWYTYTYTEINLWRYYAR